jgi:mannosyltransferase
MVLSATSPLSAKNPRWLSAAIVAAISIIALTLRLHMIGARSFWVDEGISVAIARLSWSEFFGILWRREGNMSLYYILLRGWLFFAHSDATIRALSAIASTAAVIAIYFLGKKLSDRNTGAIAAILLALNVFHIRYAQEARSYALLSLAVILATWCFVSAVESQSQNKWALYAIVSAAAVYLHFFAVFVIAAHFLSAIIWKRPIPWRNIFVSAVLFALLVLPVAAFLHTNSRNHQLDWVKFPTGREFYGFLLLFTGQAGIIMLCISLAIAAVVIAQLVLGSQKQNSPQKSFPLGVITLWLLLPPIVTLAISLAHPLFVPRYMTISLPALALVLARGISMFPTKWRTLPLVILLAFSAWGIHNYYATIADDPEDWRSAAQFFSSHVQSHDSVLFNNGSARAVFEYYTTRNSSSPLRNILFPSHGDQMTMRDFEGVPNLPFVKFKTRNVNRLWVVDWIVNSSAASLLDKSFRQSESQNFQNVTVSLYVRNPAESSATNVTPITPLQK